MLMSPQGQVTLMPLNETGPKSNLSKILCLTSLSACLMKILSNIKSLSSGQYFPHNMYLTMGD